MNEAMDVSLDVQPQVFAENVLAASYGKWVKVTGQFTATSEAEYLIIGNFFSDSMTNAREACPNSLKYAYYYIDDVKVKKERPIINVPLKEDVQTYFQREVLP